MNPEAYNEKQFGFNKNIQWLILLLLDLKDRANQNDRLIDAFPEMCQSGLILT